MRECRYEVINFTRYDGNSSMVSLKRRPSIHKESKALATSRKTAPVRSFSSKFILTLSTNRASSKVVLSPDRNPNCSSLGHHRLRTTEDNRNYASSDRGAGSCCTLWVPGGLIRFNCHCHSQRDVKLRTLVTRGQRVTVTMKCGVGNCPLHGRDRGSASGAATPTEPEFRGFPALPNILLGHVLAETFNQESSASVFWQSVGLESHTHPCIAKGQHPHRGHEAVGSFRYKGILALLSPPVSSLSHFRNSLSFSTPVTKRRFIHAFLRRSFLFHGVRTFLPSGGLSHDRVNCSAHACFTRGSLLVAPCSAVTSSETVSKLPAALAAWDVPALTRRSVLAAPLGVVSLFTTVAKFPAALADWNVLAGASNYSCVVNITRGNINCRRGEDLLHEF